MERNERAPGEHVGGYEILATLGAGAAGTVYRAQDGAGQLVALKLLHSGYATSQESRIRLMREVAALQKVSHPAVARVLDAEADDAEPFIVTELIDGPSLEDEVMGGGPLEAAELYELAQQLADALRAVHDVGLVHRDIKPSNILVTRNGPVLIDFGIAQELADARVTSHGFVMGTPGYLAPQMLDGESPDQNTDWWGWAGSLVFAATGRAPFGVRPLDTVLARVRSGTADLAGLGPLTQTALNGALQADPTLRLAPEEVLTQLRHAADTSEQHVVPSPLVGIAHTEWSDVGTKKLNQHEPLTADQNELSGAGATAVMPVTMQPSPGEPGSLTDESHDDGEEFGASEDPGYERPIRLRRPWVMLALALPPVLAAGLYPGLTALVVLGVLLIFRTVGVTSQALHDRRELRGVRRSDGAWHTLLFPWYVVRAFFGLLPAILVAGSSAVIVLGALWWTLQTNRWVPIPLQATSAGTTDSIDVTGTQNAPWVFVAALCVAATVALFVLWFGPLSGTTRDGARITMNQLAPGTGGALGTVVVVLGLSAVLVLWLVVEKQTVWWPFTGPPDLS